MRLGRAQPSTPFFGRRIAPATTGTITSQPWVNNTGTSLPSLAVTVFIYNVSTGALIATKTGSTDSGGVWAFTDALFVPGTSYRCVCVFTVSGAEGMDTYAAA